jgi:hypothetical protein
MARKEQEDREPKEWFICPDDPNPYDGPALDGRAADGAMGDLHGRTAHEIARLLRYGTVRTKLATLGHSIKFLKDNNITSQLKADNASAQVLKALPTVEELERIMTNSPD